MIYSVFLWPTQELVDRRGWHPSRRQASINFGLIEKALTLSFCSFQARQRIPVSIRGNLSLSLLYLSLDVFALFSRLLFDPIGSRLVVHKVVRCLPELEPFFFFIDDVVGSLGQCGFLSHWLCIAVTPLSAGTTIPRWQHRFPSAQRS